MFLICGCRKISSIFRGANMRMMVWRIAIVKRKHSNMLSSLRKRFFECGLELHPEKTKIVYCKDGKRKESYPNISFYFLGYTFKPRLCENRRDNILFISFTPAASKRAQKPMRAKTRKLRIRNRTDLSLDVIACWYNPILQGWINYYGKYRGSEMYAVWRHFNKTLVAWARRKYKSLKRHKTRAAKFMQGIAERNPNLFAHWRAGMVGVFA